MRGCWEKTGGHDVVFFVVIEGFSTLSEMLLLGRLCFRACASGLQAIYNDLGVMCILLNPPA